jgi:superfamily II DNA or RNA helicase
VDSPFAPLLNAVRRAAPTGVWSAGVKLARAEAVALETSEAEEVVLRVRTPGRPVAPTVVMYPGERDWDCDCSGRMRPCEHIVAAALFLAPPPPEPTDARAGAPEAAAPASAATAATGSPPESGGGRPTVPAAVGGQRGPAAATAPARTRTLAALAQVAYRLARDGGGLRCTRVVVRTAPTAGDGQHGEGGDDDGAVTGTAALARAGAPPVVETPLTQSLATYRHQRDAADLHLEEWDLRADLLLESGARGVLSPSKLDALLAILTGARQVTLDGRPVAVSDERIRPRAVVTDRGPRDDDDLCITITRDPRVTEVLTAGVVLAGEAIHRIDELELTGAYLQHLPQVRMVPAAAAGELATRTLPELAGRMPVDVRTRRVPAIVRDVPPRVMLSLEQVGGGLSVLPTLVYGQPALVRIDDGRMVHLGGPVPLRDEPAERRLVQKLRDELNLVPGRRATFEGPDAPRFAQKLERWRGDLVGNGARLLGAGARLTPILTIDSSPGSGTPGLATDGPGEVRFGLTFQITRDTPGAPGTASTIGAEAVLGAWREGLGLVALDGGGWASLPQDFLARHGQRLADLLAARAPDGRLASHALPALGVLATALDHPPPPGLDRLARLADGFAAVPPAPLPADLTASLRPYQRQAVDWLAFLRGAGLGAILADDMGLGKTLEALCAVEGPALVVCPTSLLANWRSEIARFRPSLSVSMYHGPSRRLDPAAAVTLTSYAILRLDSDRLAAQRWRTLILDEAQAIKNPDSQAARAACALDAELRIALSGTPLENRLDELWSLAHFTNRGLLGGRRDFDDRFARPIADGDREATARLREKLRPFLLRRLKREVAPELPPRTDAILRVSLDERERAVYDAVRAATRADVVALMDGGGSVLAALEALLRLRQAACHPGLVPGQTATTSSKVEALHDALENVAGDGHKALVFSQWTSLLDKLEPGLLARDIPFVRLDGSTRDRAGVVSRFQAPDGPPVMLLSLKAGGVGLNLTAADHVFLMDPWWNPAAEDQAADRAHRIGQDRPVMVYRLVASETVEEKIIALQERKRALAEAALGGQAVGAPITRQDLLDLLE